MRSLATYLIIFSFYCKGSVPLYDNTSVESLIAYYPFNGNTDDESTNDIHGINYGAHLVADRFGNENSAYIFDGKDDFIWLGDDPRLSPSMFTITAWFKTLSVKSGPYNTMYIIRNRNYGYGLNLNWYDYENYTSYPGSYDGFTWINADTAYKYRNLNVGINDGEWHFICMTFDGHIFKMYLDQLLIYSDSSLEFSYCYYLDGYVAIGRDADHPSDYFEGYIDDVRIFNIALNTKNINQIYSENGWQINK